ncbi:unnamed protein product, partial [marine sediment metagenome]
LADGQPMIPWYYTRIPRLVARLPFPKGYDQGMDGEIASVTYARPTG